MNTNPAHNDRPVNVAVTGTLADGRQWWLEPLLYDVWQLATGPADSGRYERAWHYDSYDAVTAALIDWIADEADEPAGWYRAIDQTGRCRLDARWYAEQIQW